MLKELLELDYLIMKIRFHYQCQPGMVGTPWNHIGIGIPVLFLQGVGIGQDNLSVSQFPYL